MLSRLGRHQHKLVQMINFKILQRLLAGQNGMIGLCVARSVEVEPLIEEESVFLQNAPTLTVNTTDALVADMKRKSVTKNVVQVS